MLNPNMRLEKFHIKDLTEVIHSITVIGKDEPDPGFEQSVRFYADGLPGVMFIRSEKSPILGCGKKLEHMFFYGQTVKPVNIVATGPYEAIIMHLYPHSIRRILGIHAAEITDNCIGFSDWGKPQEIDNLNYMVEKADTWTCIRFLSDIIRARMYAGKVDGSIRTAVELISQSHGEIDLSTLPRNVNLSERSLQRKFLEHVGTSPNLFKRIQKFSSVMNGIHSGNYTNLTDLSYSQGFADQSHFIRFFKQFTGIAPGEYLESRNSGWVGIE